MVLYTGLHSSETYTFVTSHVSIMFKPFFLFVSDDEKALTQFAHKAQKKILSPLEGIPMTVPPELFSFRDTEQKSGKRQIKVTERAKQSKDQEEPPDVKKPKNKKKIKDANNNVSALNILSDIEKQQQTNSTKPQTIEQNIELINLSKTQPEHQDSALKQGSLQPICESLSSSIDTKIDNPSSITPYSLSYPLSISLDSSKIPIPGLDTVASSGISTTTTQFEALNPENQLSQQLVNQSTQKSSQPSSQQSSQQSSQPILTNYSKVSSNNKTSPVNVKNTHSLPKTTICERFAESEDQIAHPIRRNPIISSSPLNSSSIVGESWRILHDSAPSTDPEPSSIEFARK